MLFTLSDVYLLRYGINGMVSKSCQLSMMCFKMSKRTTSHIVFHRMIMMMTVFDEELLDEWNEILHDDEL